MTAKSSSDSLGADLHWLRDRALRALAQREHSPQALRQSLLRAWSRRQRLAALAAASAEPAGPDALDAPPGPAGDAHLADPEATAALVDRLLAELQQRGLLCADRFVESRLNLRSGAWGLRRIQLELGQHGLALQPAQRQALQASEFERAMALWQRRFGRLPPPGSQQESARQGRHLAARGFSADVIRRVLQAVRAAPPHNDDEPA